MSKMIVDAGTGASRVEPYTPAEEADRQARIALGPLKVENYRFLREVTTTTAAATEILRVPLATNSAYRACLELIAIDMGNGNRRYINAVVLCARLGAGAMVDGFVVVANLFNNATSQAWNISAPSAVGNDVVIQVTGQAGRTIQWQLTGEVRQYRPSGV